MKNLGQRDKKEKATSCSNQPEGGHKISSYKHQAHHTVMGNPTNNVQEIANHVAFSIRSPLKVVVNKSLDVSKKDKSQLITSMKRMESSHKIFHSNVKQKCSRLDDTYPR